jgi:ribosome-binding protein aMBF1 (putative translation factor)
MDEINFQFKRALLLTGMKQSAVANSLGIKENRLSKIIHGHVTPNDEEKKRLNSFTKDVILSCGAEVLGEDGS